MNDANNSGAANCTAKDAQGRQVQMGSYTPPTISNSGTNNLPRLQHRFWRPHLHRALPRTHYYTPVDPASFAERTRSAVCPPT